MSDFNFNKEFQREAANDRAKAAFMRRTRKIMAAVVKMLQGAGLVVQSGYYMGIGGGDYNLSLTGNCRDRDLFVALMRRAKWTPNMEADPKSHHYWTKWTNAEVDAALGSTRLYVTFTSNECRQVQVGTRMVEEAVYETVCDET